MRKALKVRIYPNSLQTAFLNQQFGAVRMVYNKSLAIIRHRYKFHAEKLKAARDIKPLLVVAKRSRKYHWLKQFDSIALQQACRHLDAAFINFFTKRTGFPKFKSRRGKQSTYHCTGIQCGDNWIKIPKLKAVIKARIHRSMAGCLKSITLSRTSSGKYYAALLFDDGKELPAPCHHMHADRITGIDVGIAHLLSDSNGNQIDNPRYLNKAQKNLRRKQKSLSRKQKGSRGRARARLLLAKSHEKVANARRDFQHKLSRRLIDENQAIIVETLKIKNMLKNHCLARQISDAAWSDLITKLSYKALQSGKHLVKIDQWFASTKTCSCCGHKLKKLPLSLRQWSCSDCGIQHDRDINAAKNIKQQGILKLKAEGLSVSANGSLRKTGHALAVA